MKKKVIKLEKTNKTLSYLSDFRALYTAAVCFLHLILKGFKKKSAEPCVHQNVLQAVHHRITYIRFQENSCWWVSIGNKKCTLISDIVSQIRFLVNCKAVFSLLTRPLQLKRALLTSPAVSAALRFPWHTPGSSAGIAAGSVSSSKESESQTAPNWKLPDSPKNFMEKAPKGQALLTKLEIHEGLHSERKQVGYFHAYIHKPCKQPLLVGRKISEFSGLDTIPTQTERPRYTVTQHSFYSKRPFSLHH